MKYRINRRGFLKTAAVGTAGLCILENSQSVWAADANGKLNLALVGTGGRGRGFIGKVARLNHNLVAVCDVDRYRMNELANLPEGTRKFQDFRKMLEEMGSGLDGVIIATTDHNHAAISAAAIKHGKHVFCEKPLTHDISEARVLRKMAKDHPELKTQMGNQGIATDTYRRVLEQVQQGAVGEVREVHLWFDGLGGQGTVTLPEEPVEVPEDLDWDTYLGPVAVRPYHPYYVRGHNWRAFSTGTLGVCFTHSVHMTFRGLNLIDLWDGKAEPGARIRMQAEYSELTRENYPVWQIVRYEIPARGNLPPVRVNCYNGREQFMSERGLLGHLQKIAGRPLDWGSGWAATSGSLLVGSKGVVYTNPHNSKCVLLPEGDFPNQGGPPQTIPSSNPSRPTISDGETDIQILREWTDACTGGKATFSDFNRAAPVTEFTLAGNIATLFRQPIEFDPVACKITNNEEADQMLRPARREGWTL